MQADNPPPASADPHGANLRRHRKMSGPGVFLVTKCIKPRLAVLTSPVVGRSNGGRWATSPAAAQGRDTEVAPTGHARQSPAEAVINALNYLATEERIYLAAFVVMPDHWHAILGVRRPNSLPGIMHSIGTWVGRQTRGNLGRAGAAWQAGYHDRQMRTSRQFSAACAYVEHNPVRRGLAAIAESWPWSSASPAVTAHLLRPWPWSFPADDDEAIWPDSC
jgi:REP element-mobilizing transposase RayT